MRGNSKKKGNVVVKGWPGFEESFVRKATDGIPMPPGGKPKLKFHFRSFAGYLGAVVLVGGGLSIWLGRKEGEEDKKAVEVGEKPVQSRVKPFRGYLEPQSLFASARRTSGLEFVDVKSREVSMAFWHAPKSSEGEFLARMVDGVDGVLKDRASVVALEPWAWSKAVEARKSGPLSKGVVSGVENVERGALFAVVCAGEGSRSVVEQAVKTARDTDPLGWIWDMLGWSAKSCILTFEDDRIESTPNSDAEPKVLKLPLPDRLDRTALHQSGTAVLILGFGTQAKSSVQGHQVLADLPPLTVATIRPDPPAELSEDSELLYIPSRAQLDLLRN